nr:hypothetical protein CFP56_53616 [Quercus suber]
MSSLASLIRLHASVPFVLRVVRFQAIPIRAPRHFTTTPLLRLKEDKSQKPDEIEKAKQEQMRTGERKRELESHSEESVKAEQEHGKVEDHDEHIEDLQKETAGKSEAEKGQ